MKSKQKTYEGSYAFSECNRFIEAMMEIYDVKEVFLKKISHKDSWVLKWRVIVKYG